MLGKAAGLVGGLAITEPGIIPGLAGPEGGLAGRIEPEAAFLVGQVVNIFNGTEEIGAARG